MPRGRPTKLTPEVQQRIYQAIAAGNYYEAAAAYGGVDYPTMRLWLIRGEKLKSGIYFDFYEAIRKAEAEAEVRIVAHWQQQIPENWAAARDFLARRFPDRWGPHIKVDITEDIRVMARSLGIDEEEAVREAEGILRLT